MDGFFAIGELEVEFCSGSWDSAKQKKFTR